MHANITVKMIIGVVLDAEGFTLISEVRTPSPARVIAHIL
jgi:hypothetical protein